jgi:deoxyribodipyrimidine photo-lyase
VWDLVAAAAAGESLELPPVGEEGAHAAWEQFLDTGLDRYGSERDRPDLDSTSQLSPYLKLGVLHPRTLLHDLAHGSGLAGAGARTVTAPVRLKVEDHGT